MAPYGAELILYSGKIGNEWLAGLAGTNMLPADVFSAACMVIIKGFSFKRLLLFQVKGRFSARALII